MNKYQDFAHNQTKEYYQTLTEMGGTLDDLSAIINKMPETVEKLNLKVEQVRLIGIFERFNQQLMDGQMRIMERM